MELYFLVVLFFYDKVVHTKDYKYRNLCLYTQLQQNGYENNIIMFCRKKLKYE